MMEFVYRNQKYSWEEWNKDYGDFVDSIELPDDFRIDINIREHSLLQDIGYSIAIDKFIELYSMIASARFALMNAYQKFYDSNVISWESGYQGHLWMRFQYLKNAIVWYNSCEDYIYQILWFAYDMYPNPITSKEEYLLALKGCSYGKIYFVLEKLEKQNEHAKDLKEKVHNYRYDTDVNYLREDLANNLKHRANVQVEGLKDLRMMGFSIKSKEGTDVFNSKWIEPRVIDIDDTIKIVRNVHIKLIEYGRYVLKFMNLDDMFQKDEQGNAILNIRRKKSDYKKIIIER